ELLRESLDTALTDKSNYIDDLAYHTAVHEWTNILEIGDKRAYEKQFNGHQPFPGRQAGGGPGKKYVIVEPTE
ncbi:MAG: prephenate dehydrogenase, partial [Leadbetterella sp.]|nr:prephenate dehydrogenase [Leadbetterella sp.]